MNSISIDFKKRMIAVFQKPARFVVWTLIVLGLFGAARYLYQSYETVNYPYMVNLGEPPLTQAIQGVHAGRSPYRKLDTPPYSLVPYGPVYTGIASLAYFIDDRPFVGGRLLTLFSTLMVSLVVCLVLKRHTSSWAMGIFTGILFLSHPYTNRWGVQVNVDMSGVALSAAAFYLLSSVGLPSKTADRNRNLLILGGLCTVLAFFTKSSCVAGAGAFFFTMCFRRKFKLAIGFFLATAAIAGVIYSLLNVATDGQYYFQTTYEISKRLFFWQFIPRFWSETVQEAPLWVGATVIFLIGSAVRRRFGFHFWYLLLTVLLTVSLGKQGSDTNYLLPWAVASTMASGILFHAVLKGHQKILSVAVCAIFLWHNFSWGAPYRGFIDIKESYERNKAYYDKISTYVLNTPGKILSEDMGLLIANGRTIYYEPFPMGQMSYSGVWDEQIILDELRRKEFSLAILFFYAPALKGNRTFTPGFMKIFNENYRFVGHSKRDGEKEAGLYFYIPK